jgi:hypothetical protein
MNIFNVTSKALLYIGLAVGVIGMGAAIANGTANQANYVPGGAELNKERWHEDPFGDIAQKVKENA